MVQNQVGLSRIEALTDQSLTLRVHKVPEAIHALELKYHGVLHQADLVAKDEEARRLKLRVLVLKDEVANLRDQLADKESKIYTLSQRQDGIRAELENVNQTCIAQESQLRLQARQHSELQVTYAPGCRSLKCRSQYFRPNYSLSTTCPMIPPKLSPRSWHSRENWPY